MGTTPCIVGVIKHSSLDIKKPTKVICISHATGTTAQCKTDPKASLLLHGKILGPYMC